MAVGVMRMGGKTKFQIIGGGRLCEGGRLSGRLRYIDHEHEDVILDIHI